MFPCLSTRNLCSLNFSKYKYSQEPILLGISKYKYYLPGTYFTGHFYRAGGNGTAGTAMAVLVFEGEK